MFTPSQRLGLIDVKIKRAEHHILDLQRQITAFQLSNPYRIFGQHNPHSGQTDYYIGEIAVVPDEIAAITGDALHNLRSALDHLAYQLYLVGTGLPFDDKWTGRFLIERSAKEFESRLKGKVKGMRQDAIDAIRACEPYKGGKGEAFWTLNELNNTDKHRLIVTIASVYDGMRPRFTLEVLGPVEVQWAEIVIGRPVTARPLKKGDVLFSAKPNPKGKTHDDYKIAINVAIHEPGIVEGKPAVETLKHFADLVRNTVALFGRCLT